MEDSKLNELVDEWIEYQKLLHKNRSIQKEGEQPSSASRIRGTEVDCIYDEPELLWRFVLCAYKRQLPEYVFSDLAAGPLEDLLSWAGSEFIDKIEELAKWDDKFNLLLGGVWQKDTKEEVWRRVEKVRRKVW